MWRSNNKAKPKWAFSAQCLHCAALSSIRTRNSRRGQRSPFTPEMGFSIFRMALVQGIPCVGSPYHRVILPSTQYKESRRSYRVWGLGSLFVDEPDNVESKPNTLSFLLWAWCYCGTTGRHCISQLLCWQCMKCLCIKAQYMCFEF